MDIDDFNFDDSDDDGLDLTSLGRPSSEHFPPHGDFGFDEDEMGGHAVGSQHRQRHQLRSRPKINFIGQCSIVGSLPPSTVASRPRSHLSGDSGPTQYSNPSAQHLYPRKIYSDSYPRPSPELIATLTVTKLHNNPHYCRLRQKYERLTDIITAYAERDAMAHVVKRKAVITAPDVFQVPGDADSRASSLGPSDSASQQTRGGLEADRDRAIERLLKTVEQPSLRPSFLPPSVLWRDKDCKMDMEGDILTEQNPCQPKMALAIRCPDGSIASAQEYSNMRHSADIIVQNLVERVSSDSRTTGCGGSSKSLTKTFVKGAFGAEYRRAVLDLEAEQKLLHLCSGHWKADAMITKAFQRRNAEEKKRKAATNCKQASSSELNPSDPKDSRLLGPSPAVPLPQLWDTASVNVAKRALELSPGPKSPSVSHDQKRSKDNTMYSGQKTRVPSNSQKPLGARDIAPTFLSRTEASEPAPANLRPRDVDPSADNLIAILKSQFPSLTNAPNLLRSMNAQSSFKQGKTSEKIMTLLERVRSADPGSPDIDKDNTGQSWGHYQFTAGDISPSSSLTSWKDVRSVATAFKLVAAAIRTCQEARLMCANAGMPRTSGFISDVYLEKTLECLESCWVGAGGTITSHSRTPMIPTTPSYRDVVMSSPARKLTIKLKPLALVPDVAPSDVPTGSAGPDATSCLPPAVVTKPTPPAASAEPTQPAASTEPTPGPSTASDEGARADAKSLKSLHVPELQAWISEHKLSMPKSKRKEDLIASIVKSTEFAQVSKSAIEKIIEKV
ncbi:hypothetical protein EDB83DRAFT_2517992 [Lactarius deliciosus]|nr:hypothetical protein EDB83DRAFT_2517992 [Lactarius deliciosus]